MLFLPSLMSFVRQELRSLLLVQRLVCELEQGLAEYRKDGKDVNFPLLSDETLKALKLTAPTTISRICPLHGTFLIDESGHVRWQDIGHEPFTEVDFL